MKRVVISGMIGNALEWYDYALYGVFSAIIGKLFFPSDNAYTSLIATFGVFAAGFLMRPLGAVLFGYLGDRYGRKFSLTLSILMMAIPTACIGLLPTYAQIGVLAPVLLTIIRLLQGLSLGGEFSGSITFLVEHAPDHRRGLAGSASMFSLAVGMLIGALVGAGFSYALTPEDLLSWGWRVPFLLGLVIGLVGFYIRHYTDESPKYEEAKRQGALDAAPVRCLLKSHRWALLQGIAFYLSVTVPFYIMTVFMNGYLPSGLGLSQADTLIINAMVMTMMILWIPPVAWLSDRIGRTPIMRGAAIGYILLAYPCFALLSQGGFWPAFFGLMLLASVGSCYISVVPTVLVEMFPTSVRYTGMALAYNIAAAAFGGTAPMVGTWLVKETGDPKIIAFYIMACAVLTLVALHFYKDRYRDPLH